jgi:hypothetical protein
MCTHPATGRASDSLGLHAPREFWSRQVGKSYVEQLQQARMEHRTKQAVVHSILLPTSGEELADKTPVTSVCWEQNRKGCKKVYVDPLSSMGGCLPDLGTGLDIRKGSQCRSPNAILIMALVVFVAAIMPIIVMPVFGRWLMHDRRLGEDGTDCACKAISCHLKAAAPRKAIAIIMLDNLE